MGEYFWAGLIAGLFIWVVTEVCCQIFRRGPMRRVGAAAFAVLTAEGHVEDMEYLLRRAKAQLAEGEFPAGRILVGDRGMDAATRQIALRFEGARLCTEKDLGPVLAGMLPARNADAG